MAEAIKDEPYHIIVGAGSTWPEAHYYGMCILEEMQWIRTRPVHASDFFHGTLELVDKDVSVLLLKGEDAYRPLVERVERFLPAYTSKVTVFDTAEFALPGISPATRALLSPIVLATLFERLSAHLEVKRDASADDAALLQARRLLAGREPMHGFDVATVGDNCIDRYGPPLGLSLVGGNAVNVAVQLARLGVARRLFRRRRR